MEPLGEFALLARRGTPSVRVDERRGGRVVDFAGTRADCGVAIYPRRGQGDVRPCRREAGAGTVHRGVGYCSDHGGNTPPGLRVGALLMGQALTGRKFGDPLQQVSPWDALLEEVTRSTDMVRRLDAKLDEATGDDDLAPDGRLYHWVQMRERERQWLGRVAKMAVDAGVAERLLQRVELEGEAIARVLGRALVDAGLTSEQEAVVRLSLRRELEALASVPAPILGEVVDTRSEPEHE